MNTEARVLLNSSQVTPDCMVLINLSNNDNSSKRINVSENITLRDLGLGSGTSAQAPSWADAQAKIAAVCANGSYSPSEKSEAVAQITKDFTDASAKYQEVNGGNITDMVAVKAASYICEKYGFSSTDKDGTVVLKAENLLVATMLTPKGELLFSVTGTAVWGN